MQSSIALSYIPTVLMAILLLVGIVLLAVNRRNHGNAAVMGMLGCILLLVGLISNVLFGLFLPALMDSGLSTPAAVLVWRLVSLLFDAAGTGLLIFAVIARRNPPQPTQPGVPGWQGGQGGQQPWPPNYG